MPDAWWTGKLIAPELPALIGCALALSCLARGNMVTAGLAFGVAVGFKIPAAPLALLFPLFAWHRRDARQFALSALVGALGFVLMNPAILRAPAQTLGQFLNTSRIGGDSRGIADVLLHDLQDGLDMVSSGGFVDFVMPLGVFAALLAGLAYTGLSRLLLVISGVVFVVFVAAFMETTTYFRFYWFPFAALLVFLGGETERPGFVLPVILLAGLAPNSPTIMKHLGHKAEQVAAMERIVETSACINEAPATEAVAEVLDHFDYGFVLDGRLDAPVVQLFSAGKAPSHVVIGDRIQVGWAFFPPTHRYRLREIARCPNARVYAIMPSER